tara:strand:+ start:290 stop:571 length:282 start_codon:yes stop_codon:yes gene_type:complete
MGTPFKMKGSPMQRNFGIGSPLHDDEKKTKMVKGSTIFGYTADDIKNKAKKAVKKGVKYVKDNPTILHTAVEGIKEGFEGYAKRKKAFNERNN